MGVNLSIQGKMEAWQMKGYMDPKNWYWPLEILASLHQLN